MNKEEKNLLKYLESTNVTNRTNTPKRVEFKDWYDSYDDFDMFVGVNCLTMGEVARLAFNANSEYIDQLEYELNLVNDLLKKHQDGVKEFDRSLNRWNIRDTMLTTKLAAAEARIAHAEGIIKHYSTTVPGNPYVGQIAKIYMDKMRENGYE